MKYLPLLLLLAGCEQQKLPQQTWGYDQCARREIFLQCMAALPAGPAATKYSDWDEVVEACEDTARGQSVRNLNTIKPECKSE